MALLRRINRWLDTPIQSTRSRGLFLLCLGLSWGALAERLVG